MSEDKTEPKPKASADAAKGIKVRFELPKLVQLNAKRDGTRRTFACTCPKHKWSTIFSINYRQVVAHNGTLVGSTVPRRGFWGLVVCDCRTTTALCTAREQHHSRMIRGMQSTSNRIGAARFAHNVRPNENHQPSLFALFFVRPISEICLWRFRKQKEQKI